MAIVQNTRYIPPNDPILAPNSLDPNKDNRPVPQIGQALPTMGAGLGAGLGGAVGGAVGSGTGAGLGGAVGAGIGAGSDLYENLLRNGVTAAGMFDQIGRVQDIGDDALTRSQAIGQQAVEGTEFRPFTTTSQTGNVSVANDGSIDARLSDPLQAISDQALGGASDLFAQAAIDPNTRQGQIFQQLMAGLAPQQERERLALEGRLQSQGRGGIRSAAFGGSPEQLARQKAQQEAQLNAMIQARGIGSAEQLQQANIGAGMLSAGMDPNKQLLNELTPAIQSAQLGAQGQLAGADLQAQSETTGLEARIQAEKIAAGLYGDAYSAASNVAGNIGSNVDSAGGLFDYIKELRGKIT